MAKLQSFENYWSARSRSTCRNRIEIVSEAEAAILIADAEEVGRMPHGPVSSPERSW
jgi:hypothetical protein